MKQKNIILIIVSLIVVLIMLFFAEKKFGFIKNALTNKEMENDDYLYGSEKGEHGAISLKVKLDNSGAMKEITVLEHPDNEICNQALQKLIRNSLDKQSSEEIDAVSGATETTNVYKSIIHNMIDKTPNTTFQETTNDALLPKVSLQDPEVIGNIEREIINPEGFKSGIGGYVFNTFQDADYNKNGNLVTNEYICAVVLNQYDRIEDVRFDHIVSNISFDRNGQVPTGGAKAYVFASDKSKAGFNGLVNDGNFVNIFEFEDIVLTLRHFTDIKNKYLNKRGYAPLIYALENAIDNARYIGAGNYDTLGLACSKVLKKSDILNATDNENGHVNFTSNYCMVTVGKDKTITSCMFDTVDNKVVLTDNGKILGSREKEIYTLNELANTTKYSKIDGLKYQIKVQENVLADFLRSNTMDNILSIISNYTDDKGMGKEGTVFESFTYIDFIEFVDIISRAFVEAIKIKVR